MVGTFRVKNSPRLYAIYAISCHASFAIDEANECRCKDSADCSTPEINVCVRVGDDAIAESQTMSECEAGLRRCKGETVSLVSILPCAS